MEAESEIAFQSANAADTAQKLSLRALLHTDFSVRQSPAFYTGVEQLAASNPKRCPLYPFFKRLFDLLFALAALAVWAVPLAVIALAIRLDSPGPAFFPSSRVGRQGRVFFCLKFRTLSVQAPAEVPTDRAVVDAYCTRVGRFLRKTSLDELPQLVNILIGDMSLIGYRPLVPAETDCNKLRGRLGVFSARPGISGLAQICGRDDVTPKNKAYLDAYAVSKASILFDLALALQTVRVVVTRKGNRDND